MVRLVLRLVSVCFDFCFAVGMVCVGCLRVFAFAYCGGCLFGVVIWWCCALGYLLVYLSVDTVL